MLDIPLALFSMRTENGSLRDCNDRFADLLGYPNRQACLRDYQLEPHWEKHECFGALLLELRQRGRLEDVEVRLQSLQGRQLWTRMWLRIDPATGCLDGACIDTAQTNEVGPSFSRLEKMAAHQHARLIHLAIAHEVSQPLLALRSYLQLLLRKLEGSDRLTAKLKELARKAETQALRASDVLARFREGGGWQTDRYGKHDINQLLAEVIELAEVDLEHHRCTVQFQAAEDLPLLELDPVEIQQVVLNLIRNAAESLHERQGVSPSIIYLRTSRQEESLLIEVEDHGLGIPPGQVEYLFEPLCTTKKGGLGIGLSMCRTLLEGYGARIWYTPAQPQGAIFHIAFTAPPSSAG